MTKLTLSGKGEGQAGEERLPENVYQSLMTGSTSLPNSPMFDIVASWDILDSCPYIIRWSMPSRLWMYSSFSSTWSGVPQTIW